MYDTFDAGIISKELYISRSKSLDEEIVNVKDNIAKTKREVAQFKDVTKKTSDYLELFKKYETVIEVNRELLISLVDKILVENINEVPPKRNKPKKIRVVFKFQDEFRALEQFIGENKLVSF